MQLPSHHYSFSSYRLANPTIFIIHARAYEGISFLLQFFQTVTMIYTTCRATNSGKRCTFAM